MYKTKCRLWSRITAVALLFVIGFIVTLSGVFSFTRVGTPEKAQAATQSTIGFQARLYNANGSVVPDGYYNIEFKLYNQSSGGSSLWTETYYDSNGASPGNDNRLRVVNGYLSAPLGSLTAFSGIDWDQEHWVTLNVGGSNQTATPTYDGEMTPRLKLTAVPYALKAGTAANVRSNNTNSASTNSDNITIQSGNATGATSNSGNITLDVGTATQTAGTISIGTANTSGITIGRTGVTTSVGGNLSVTGTSTLTGATTVAGLLTANGNLTLQTGDTFTINGDALTDLTGTGLTVTSGALTVDNSALDDSFFIQGGNSFGATAVIGTNDSNNFSIETNNAVVATFTTAGQLQLPTTGSGGGILLGGDAQLYRSAADTLSLGNGDTLRVANASGNNTVTLGPTGIELFGTNQTFTSAPPNGITMDNTYTIDYASGRIPGLAYSEATFEADQSLEGGSGTGGSFIWSANTIKNVNGVSADLGSQKNFVDANTYQADGASINLDTQLGFISSSTFNTINGGTLSASGQIGYYSDLQVNSGATIDNRYGVFVGNAYGTGTLTNQIGIEVADLTKGATTDIGVRIGTADTYSLQLSGTGGTANTGITFGTDTNLYRSAANTLMTDDSLTVGTNLSVTGTSTLTGATTVAGLLTANGNLTLQTGDTFTINGDALTDLTGTGLTVTSGALTVDNSVLDNSFFIQGGNSFGATAVIGTNDNNNFSIETNNAVVATFTTAGQLQLPTTGATGGILLGGDAQLYRSAANTIRGGGGDNIVVENTGGEEIWLVGDNANATYLAVYNDSSGDWFLNSNVNGETDARFIVDTGGGMNWGSGSATQDTNLYRSGVGTLRSDGNFQLGQGANRTFDVQARTSNAVGNNLTIAAGAAGSGASAYSGGTLSLQGGAAAGTGNANGGAITIAGGTGIGTGTQGLVNLSTTAFSSSSVQTFGAGVNSITAGLVDQYSTIPINATDTTAVVSVPDPAQNTIIGRILYISARNGSTDFTLRLNASGTPINIAMKANSTATLIWNGDDWTAAGASSSTDLQSAYNNTLTSAGGAELVLNAPGGNADGLTIRNNATTPITGGILEVQTSIGSNLLSVNNNAIEYATNGGAETQGASSSTFPSNTWGATPSGGTVTRYTTAGDNIATGQASVSVVTTATTNHGASNRLSTSLTANLTYSVSLAVRGAANFSTMQVAYSPDGTNAGTVTCANGQTVTSGQWTRITCTFTAPASGITSSNAIFVRQTDAVAHTYYIDNLSVNVNASSTYAADGSVDDSGGFTTNWTTYGAGTTAARDTSVIYDSSASARVDTPNNSDRGIRNNLSITPQISTQYLVSFYARSGTGSISDLTVRYSRDGGTDMESCVDYSTQAITTTGWTKITCLVTTDSTTATNPDLIFTQNTAPGGTRSIYIDALSMTLNTNNSNNVQIGGANKGGPTTLFTLDRASSAPIAANNDAYLGSMYYDTTTGRIQCYEADGWGACGSAPDNIVNLNPEFSGAVLNGTGVGTMSADFCGNGGGLSVNTSLCSSGEARNYYKWTSPQATQQTYSIYVTYQLPSSFKGFASDDTVQLTARTDSTSNGVVTYQMYRNESGSISACGSETTVTSTANTWQTVGINGNESTGCSFSTSSGNAFVIFKINVKANSNASVYVGTLSFTTTGR